MWLFVDLNAFFASRTQQDRPELRGLPVAIDRLNRRFGRAAVTSVTTLPVKKYPAHDRIPFGNQTELC